jgi:glycosyltransferase involved in cell wall biosynthesis
LEVEVLGYLIGGDQEIYRPYRDEIEVKAMKTTLRPGDLFPKIRRLSARASGDIIYAFKPLMTSLAPAYYAARVISSRPLLLDVEDEEVYDNQLNRPIDIWKQVVRGWNLATSWKYTRLLQVLRYDVDATTVASETLKKRYGGHLLRHGPDEEEFDPGLEFGSTAQLRHEWGLPIAKKLALFIGTPRSHKGLDTIAEAFSRSKLKEWEFVLVGPHENQFAQPLKNKIPDRSHFLGPQAYEDTPELLALADAITIPSKDTRFAHAQVPAKLLDAMAMARPIVASRVGDLPDILGWGERGWLIDPGSPSSLSKALCEIEEKPEVAQRKSCKARKWYERNASTSAIKKKINNIIK